MFDLPPPAWRFVNGPHGKPDIDPAHGLPAVRFNISHTHGAVACAMAMGHDIGVDIECAERGGHPLEIAGAYFAPSEQALLRATSPASQRDLFFRLWTLKEAYVKARGEGLALPLDRFAFRPDDPVTISFAESCADDADDWLFRTLRPSAGHVLSLAVRHGTRNRVAVRSRPMTHSAIDRLIRTEVSVTSQRDAGWQGSDARERRGL
ncbi:4'-phosphopantetheinyl transferase superfamily protein [Marinivivus vitaminiproducens]|nr:4'-phosphopantetheinyl transferase superfamily protein [Geminicoccaceae bacterium SCSIO 64248]